MRAVSIKRELAVYNLILTDTLRRIELAHGISFHVQSYSHLEFCLYFSVNLRRLKCYCQSQRELKLILRCQLHKKYPSFDSWRRRHSLWSCDLSHNSPESNSELTREACTGPIRLIGQIKVSVNYCRHLNHKRFLL